MTFRWESNAKTYSLNKALHNWDPSVKYYPLGAFSFFGLYTDCCLNTREEVESMGINRATKSREHVEPLMSVIDVEVKVKGGRS